MQQYDKKNTINSKKTHIIDNKYKFMEFIYENNNKRKKHE